MVQNVPACEFCFSFLTVQNVNAPIEVVSFISNCELACGIKHFYRSIVGEYYLVQAKIKIEACHV